MDPVQLTEDLVNIGSVSGDEQQIADAVEAALRGLDHLEVQRFGNTVVARTHQGRGERVVIAEGLEPGERVIVEGFQKVRPGAPVSAEPWKPEEGKAAADAAAQKSPS